MEKMVLDRARKFLTDYLRGKTFNYDVIHPWREDWRFVLHHSFRVESYVSKILKAEKKNTPDADILLLTTRLAAILHDIGRIVQRENHAGIGADIVGKWIENDFPELKTYIDARKLLILIAGHSDKTGKDKDLCSAALKDADILDEIGVLSIFMAANRVDRSSAFFFNDLLERVDQYEVDFCDKQMEKLSTKTAKLILKKKKQFIKHFVQQLGEEIEGTEIIPELVGWQDTPMKTK